MSLPERAGPRPATSTGLPHQQLDQQPGDALLHAQLAAHVLAMAGVQEQPSGISVPGARALVLAADQAVGARSAFLVGREFAHLHPAPDESLHLTLPEKLARRAISAGWAEYHPLVAAGQLPATVVMVYAPRDDDELDIVAGLVAESLRHAGGKRPGRHRPAAATARSPRPSASSST